MIQPGILLYQKVKWNCFRHSKLNHYKDKSFLLNEILNWYKSKWTALTFKSKLNHKVEPSNFQLWSNLIHIGLLSTFLEFPSNLFWDLPNLGFLDKMCSILKLILHFHWNHSFTVSYCSQSGRFPKLLDNLNELGFAFFNYFG